MRPPLERLVGYGYHQLPTWSHSQNSSACAAFCFRAVCKPFELRWWKRFLSSDQSSLEVPTAAARPESHLLKTVGTPPGHSPNDNVQGGEVKTTIQSRAWRTRNPLAWDKVTPETIKHCFKKAGFVKKEDDGVKANNIIAEAVPSVDGWEDIITDPAIWFEDFVNVDEDVAVCGEITDAEIIT
ncbi:hypothetical protein J6590_093706 [Homalodisca vitripennis]|nr:hypothetical protein J6590_093706 [Homalodisca vitripennis]